MAAGRPTKYTDEMPNKLLDFMLTGGSVIRFCRNERIHKDTFYEWVKVHKEFSDAFTHGRRYEEAWWEEQGVENLCNHKFNTNLYKFMMVNKFKDNWSDKKDVNQNTEISVSEITQRKVRQVIDESK